MLHAFLPFLLAGAATQVASLPTATLSAGLVVGTTRTVPDQPSPTANLYLGVPFAQSPPERFLPPEPPAPWSTPLQAQALKPSCIQQFSGMPGNFNCRDFFFFFFLANETMQEPPKSRIIQRASSITPEIVRRKRARIVCISMSIRLPQRRRAI